MKLCHIIVCIIITIVIRMVLLFVLSFVLLLYGDHIALMFSQVLYQTQSDRLLYHVIS